MEQRGELTNWTDHALFNRNSDPMLLLDEAGRIVTLNRAMRMRLGERAGQSVGCLLGEFAAVKDDRWNDTWKRLHKGEDGELEAELSLDGNDSKLLNIQLIPEFIGGKLFVYAAVRDRSELKKAEDLIRHMMYHDTLTGLPNRMMFQLVVSREISAYESSRSGGFSLILIQLDHFRTVTDSLGYHTGDLLLKEVSERLRRGMHAGDHLSRIGTYEFALIRKDRESPEEVLADVRELRSLLLEPFAIGPAEAGVTARIGAAMYPEDGADADSLLRYVSMVLADDEESHERFGLDERERYIRQVQRKLSLDSDLRKALANNQLELHYQPQYDILNDRLIGVEALVRWRHPVQGLISPADFIPLAEETGLIIPIGDWVLRRACEQIQYWRRSEYPDLTVSVNLSIKQFQKSNLVSEVGRILQETGLHPSALELEITESTAMYDAVKVIGKLNELKAMGIRISIDDFGTGYSSLNYLKRFPLHKLKIDQSFIRGISGDPDNKVIVETILAMARRLRLEVVAEGVETLEDLSFLQQLRCDAAQGFFFSRPVDALSFANVPRGRLK